MERSWTAVPGTGCGHEAVNHVEGTEKWKELAQWRWRGGKAQERARPSKGPLGWRRWVGEGQCHHSGMLSFASLLNKNIRKKGDETAVGAIGVLQLDENRGQREGLPCPPPPPQGPGFPKEGTVEASSCAQWLPDPLLPGVPSKAPVSPYRSRSLGCWPLM